MKKIAILTSGGDAPGMNAAIRAAVRYGIYAGMEVYGIERGYAGLISNTMRKMDLRSVSDTIHRGGTILRSARCPEFTTPEGQQKGFDNLRANGIEGLIVIGGDGSFMGAKVLSEKGFPTIGIPGTIDNDLMYTDYTLGFDTATNTILDAIDKIRDTMSSHERVSVIEVMGRNCGDLALYAGIGGGAELIVVPEMKLTDEQIIEKLQEYASSGKRSGIVVLAEGAGHVDDLIKKVEGKVNVELRGSVLGHIQRGGSPSNQDRYLGTCFGAHAVQLLEKGIGNRVVGIKDNKIYDMDIVEALSLPRKFNKDLYELANIVSK